MSVTKEQIRAVMYEETNRLAINILKEAYKEAIKALKESRKMAEAIERCTLEPDKVYIHAGRIKQSAKQVLDKYPEE